MKIQKQFYLLHDEDKVLVQGITENLNGAEAFPAKGVTVVEFDDSEEAETYVKENSLKHPDELQHS